MAIVITGARFNTRFTAAGGNAVDRVEAPLNNWRIGRPTSITLQRALSACGLVLAALCAVAVPLSAQAQSTTACAAGVKEEVAKVVQGTALLSQDEQFRIEAALYDKYKACATIDAANLPLADTFYIAARQCGAKVSYVGSIFYEEMPCCGYDPQRRTFACPVKVKQPFGFGGSPLPGSREFTLHCIADTQGVYRPVGDDSVHLSNSVLAPSWQFAVVANANDNLPLVQPMNQQARRARSILSWNLRPTGCNYQPIWGNVIDYQVRLDQ